MSDSMWIFAFVLVLALVVYWMAVRRPGAYADSDSRKDQQGTKDGDEAVILRLIGYWHRGEEPDCPDPVRFVDPSWDPAERALVSAYLNSGTELFQYCGLSWCRFQCGVEFLGSKELTDGHYYWPEGLSHYLERHFVKPPQEFIDHVKGRTIEDSAAVNRRLGSPRTDIANPWRRAGADEEGRDTFVMWDRPRPKLKLDKRWWKGQKGYSCGPCLPP